MDKVKYKLFVIRISLWLEKRCGAELKAELKVTWKQWPSSGLNFCQFTGCSFQRICPMGICKSSVFRGPGKLEPCAIKWHGLVYGRCLAASLTAPGLSSGGKARLQCILGYAGPRRIHPVGPSNSGNEGCICQQHLKDSVNWDSLVMPNVTAM